MAEWVKVATKSEIAPGQCAVAQANDRQVAVYNVDGNWYATDNQCVHQGGPLGEGALDGTTITCPWHAWQYDVTTGKSTFNETMGVGCYEVRTEGEDILVLA